MRRIVILGNHPLAVNLVRQYETMGFVVEHRKEMTADGIDINDYDEVCLLTGNDNLNDNLNQNDASVGSAIGADVRTLAVLNELAARYDAKQHGGKRLTCHLLLQKTETLQILQTCDLCADVREKLDVYPFSLEEIWSRSIVLDYEPITIHSDKHVHLVIFGMGEVAETVAIQAAHIAHYPNYVRNHSLRTRITMISEDAETLSEGFIKRYQHLFDNSFYRIVKPSEEKAVKVFHKPMYEGLREDFVDVEWEFVDAESWKPDVREKLKLWAQDDKQLLTVVMADRDENRNVAMSLILPDELYQQSIPIYKYSPNAAEYDVTMPLVQMAKNVNYVYDSCYNDNIENWQGQVLSSVEIDIKKRDESWAKRTIVKRLSSLFNAMTIPSKMRSIGLNEDDWDKFYDISQQDIEILAQVEHNRWNVEELILGFRPCTDEEQEEIARDIDDFIAIRTSEGDEAVKDRKTLKEKYKAGKKVHYDLRAYNDLRPDGTGKPVQVYDLCLSAALPLIAKTFVDEKGGGL